MKQTFIALRIPGGRQRPTSRRKLATFSRAVLQRHDDGNQLAREMVDDGKCRLVRPTARRQRGDARDLGRSCVCVNGGQYHGVAVGDRLRSPVGQAIMEA